MSMGITSPPWVIPAVAGVALTGVALRLAATADAAQRARAREAIGSAAQYGLLFGLAAMAAAISAQGLTGFARSSMGLRGPWPYLLWAALDGAAGLCAVLLMRRATRGESALAPRLAVWGLVSASSAFNWAHAPDHPDARAAFALMPVIAATLFEFSLRETRQAASPPGRKLPGLTWLHPVERIRVRVQKSADPMMSAEVASRRVRIDCAARRLHGLRQVLAAQKQVGDRSRTIAAYRVRRAEHRAQAALIRVRFADLAIATDVLRQVQVLTQARALAQLDYTTQDDPQTALASLITGPVNGPPARPGGRAIGLTRRPPPAEGKIPVNGEPTAPALHDPSAARGETGSGVRIVHVSSAAGKLPPSDPYPEFRSRPPVNGDHALVDAACRIVAEARDDGGLLSQAELARRLRTEGHSVANGRLRWLSDACGLDPGDRHG